MRWRIPLLLTLVAFVAVSCDQQPVEPQPDQVAEATFDWMNNPDNGNPKILRYEDEYWWQPWDVDREWLGIMQTEPAPWFCDLGEDSGPIAFQRIVHDPEVEEGLEKLLAKGEVWVAVWDASSCNWDAGYPDCAVSCDFFTSTEPIATGYAKVSQRDNDLNAWTCERNSTNVWGTKSQGQLDLTDGSGTVAFNYNYRAVWHHGPDCDVPPDYTETLKISPDPR
jgi:hypothetical protein